MFTRSRTALTALGTLALAAGCAGRPPAASPATSGEWVAGAPDLRKTTAVVRVAPPARLKASLEAVAARTDDPDLADFLRMHAGGSFGSGFLVVHKSAEGTAPFVVTNRHVIAEAEAAEVSFGDGTTYKDCDVVFSSPKHDLAVLALPESAQRALGPGLRPLEKGAKDLLPVVASGFPGVAGRPSYQITDGKISNASFSMPELGLEPMLQHTAPIDPGSSGGPLVDTNGNLVGVNVMLMRKRSSMFFAVPSEAVIETVRHAHALVANKRSATWMTAELEKACTTLAAELGSGARSHERLSTFVSNALVADRGLESYAILARSPVGSMVRQVFYQEPMTAMRASVVARLNLRATLTGGATGACGAVNAGDAAGIAEGKPVRLSVETRGGPMELVWIFEHGTWRVAGGELAPAELLTEPDEPPPPPRSAKHATVKGAKANAKGAK